MANQSGGGRWAHVEGDHLVDDSGRIRDPSEIDVDRLEQIVMLPVSALPTSAPQIDSNGLAADLTSRLSALPAPNIDVGRLNVGLSALPAPNIDVERLAGSVDRIPDSGGHA